MCEEILSLLGQETWELIYLAPGRKFLKNVGFSSKWIYSVLDCRHVFPFCMKISWMRSSDMKERKSDYMILLEGWFGF